MCRAQGQAAGGGFLIYIRASGRIIDYYAPGAPIFTHRAFDICAPGSTNIHFSCSREHKYSVWLVIYRIYVYVVYIGIGFDLLTIGRLVVYDVLYCKCENRF